MRADPRAAVEQAPPSVRGRAPLCGNAGRAKIEPCLVGRSDEDRTTLPDSPPTEITMRFLLWLLLTASVLGNAYVNTFAGWTGATQIAASVCTGVVLLGSAAGLWLTRPRTEA
ncbi:hypothetical protein PV371_24150 [Streptomyces sp. TX20-6-3]|uniref:hypothetical protein n=2 Tax=unclassified Streptomyces TaxID=2593676 RepID=UPI0029BDD369|nr:hypothetical protein [Streptomyces sp. TX20-6-3]MDX2562727.1 hypothetical protein [Streptomyces sp. TX20-6-3]